jgi:hypothetical protein
MSRGSGWYSSPLRHILEREEAAVRSFQEYQESERQRKALAAPAQESLPEPELLPKPRIKAKIPQP